jgi:hypothetical protein
MRRFRIGSIESRPIASWMLANSLNSAAPTGEQTLFDLAPRRDLFNSGMSG